MTEEELANRIALQQLGEIDDQDYHDRLFQVKFRRGDHSAIVTEVARRIARAAFSSKDPGPGISSRLKETGNTIWDYIKKAVDKPGVKEGIIVGSVMLFKMGLWFSYRKAAREGLEIVDL